MEGRDGVNRVNVVPKVYGAARLLTLPANIWLKSDTAPPRRSTRPINPPVPATRGISAKLSSETVAISIEVIEVSSKACNVGNEAIYARRLSLDHGRLSSG